MAVPLLAPPDKHWECLSCEAACASPGSDPRTPLHSCRGLKGLMVPMVSAGTRGKHVVNMRDDYVGSEDIQTDGEGRPVMSVQTVRDDGEDCAVYVPTARLDAR